MNENFFYTKKGHQIPAISAAEMAEVDRIAVEDFGLGILQMMENAGRNTALHVMEMLDGDRGTITVLAGSGGNGGGGLCCARHLHNRGFDVNLVLSKEAESLSGAAAAQLKILMKSGIQPLPASQSTEAIQNAVLVVDALIGYSLSGAPYGRIAELIELCNANARRVISLDVPSGIDATTGATPGVAINPERTLTLALPKTGLHQVPGDLYLADIGIPPEVYISLNVAVGLIFGEKYWVQLFSKEV